MATDPKQLPTEAIADFCRRWKITRLEVFGSFLRDDFSPASDLDFLAQFEPQAGWSLLDRAAMRRELAAIVHRPVDLLNRAAVQKSRSARRRQHMLTSAQMVYAC